MPRELRRLLRVGGPLVWTMVAAPALSHLSGPPWRLWSWVAAELAFAILFALAVRTGRSIFVALQPVAVVALVLTRCDGFEGALLVLVALQLGANLDRRAGVAAIAAQSAALAAAIGVHWSPGAAALLAPPYFGFQLLAFFAAEGMARLEAAESIRVEHGRLQERLRIARELHDRIGHQMTALNLNLEAAVRGGNLEALAVAQSVGRTLVAEVRAAVLDLRDAERIDLCGALRTLAEELPAPAVHVAAPPSLQVTDPRRAIALLRCAQEIATNAARHSGAGNLWLILERSGDTLELRARDDGTGAPAFQAGNGLRGMRERLESLGGTLSVETADGRGFAVRATLPAGERR